MEQRRIYYGQRVGHRKIKKMAWGIRRTSRVSAFANMKGGILRSKPQNTMFQDGSALENLFLRIHFIVFNNPPNFCAKGKEASWQQTLASYRWCWFQIHIAWKTVGVRMAFSQISKGLGVWSVYPWETSMWSCECKARAAVERRLEESEMWVIWGKLQERGRVGSRKKHRSHNHWQCHKSRTTQEPPEFTFWHRLPSIAQKLDRELWDLMFSLTNSGFALVIFLSTPLFVFFRKEKFIYLCHCILEEFNFLFIFTGDYS